MEKRLIYMDNAATAFPKADGVAEACARYLTQAGVNVARGGMRWLTRSAISF